MPVSKKRKKHLARKPLALTPETTERWNIKLDGSRLAPLRNDPDFLTLIKIGRATNAVLYAMHEVTSNYKQRTITEKRQYRRGCFVLAGYLHEAIRLASAIKGRYLTFPPFEDLRAIALDAECRRAREFVKKVRNFTAFHLDEYDEMTRKTLSKLKLTMYVLVSGDHKGIGATYFNIVDEVDIRFLLDELSNDRYGEVTQEDLFGTIFGLAKVFLEASNEFTFALFDKIKLAEHVYRGTVRT